MIHTRDHHTEQISCHMHFLLHTLPAAYTHFLSHALSTHTVLPTIGSDLLCQPLLHCRMQGQEVTCKGEGVGSGLVACQHQAGHLGYHLVVWQLWFHFHNMLQYVSVLAVKEVTGKDALLLSLYNFRKGEIHVHTCTHVYTCTYKCAHMYTHVHACTHIQNSSPNNFKPQM